VLNTSFLKHPHSLVHIGLVCRNMDEGRDLLSRTLGVSWVGGASEDWELLIEGESRSLSMAIAHSANGSPHYELIEAKPNTPWETDAEIQLHHLCITSADPGGLCDHLESLGYRRVLGKPKDPSGYFQQPKGLLIEVVDQNLLAYLQGFYDTEL